MHIFTFIRQKSGSNNRKAKKTDAQKVTHKIKGILCKSTQSDIN